MQRPPLRPTSRLRVVVLGVGVMGRLHARVFHQLVQAFVLTGVYDVDRAARESAAEAWSVASFASEEAAIEAADLVVVASPIESHAGAARRALARGRHVLVEKPVCATAAEALDLVRSAREGQRIFVGHSERYNPAIVALKSVVQPADVRTLRIRRTASVVRPTREHGALLSLGIHDLDLIAYLTRATVSVRSVLSLDDDRADVILSTTSDAVASLHVDRRAPVRERLLEMITRDAVYRADLLAPSLDVTVNGEAPRALVLGGEEPLVAQALAIACTLDATLSAHPCDVATGLDGARALSLVKDALALRPKAMRSLEPPFVATATVRDADAE